jgi:hypothetical protein
MMRALAQVAPDVRDWWDLAGVVIGFVPGAVAGWWAWRVRQPPARSDRDALLAALEARALRAETQADDLRKELTANSAGMSDLISAFRELKEAILDGHDHAPTNSRARRP